MDLTFPNMVATAILDFERWRISPKHVCAKFRLDIVNHFEEQ